MRWATYFTTCFVTDPKSVGPTDHWKILWNCEPKQLFSSCQLTMSQQHKPTNIIGMRKENSVRQKYRGREHREQAACRFFMRINQDCLLGFYTQSLSWKEKKKKKKTNKQTKNQEMTEKIIILWKIKKIYGKLDIKNAIEGLEKRLSS